MSNVLDNDDEAPFNDQSDELNGGTQEVAISPQGQPMAPPAARRSSGRPVAPPQPQEVEEEVVEEAEEELDSSVILSDARLRLEQGSLYEMVMNHDLFSDCNADARAIKIVQREIRKFAQERMEIMLGMRQEVIKQEGVSVDFPFNALEVDALKALAAAATKGASRDSEPFVAVSQPVKKKTLSPIGGAQRSAPRPAQPAAPAKPLASKPAAPVKRAKADAAIQRILEEEGVTLEDINQVFDPSRPGLTRKEFEELTTEQVVERNRQARVTKQVPNPQAVPMPSEETMAAIYTQRATQAAGHPQMQMIMNLLAAKKPAGT